MPDIQVIRSRRRTISIEIRPDARVIVRAPLRAPQTLIDQILAEKAGWIARKVADAGRMREQIPPRQYLDGEKFLYLGKEFPLKLVQGARGSLALEGSFTLPRGEQARAEQQFSAWYRKQARKLFAERVERLSAQSGLSPQKLRISGARTRWGSCSSKGTISLAWRLVMAPLEVIDYVIIHELVHLKVHNHSKAFWQAVAALLPDYLQRRKWLKENGNRISIG